LPEEAIEAGFQTLHSEVHKLVTSALNKEELPHQWKEFPIVPVYKKGDKTGCIKYRRMLLLDFVQYFNQFPCQKFKSVGR
jgi:hypothetical protein